MLKSDHEKHVLLTSNVFRSCGLCDNFILKEEKGILLSIWRGVDVKLLMYA